MLNKDGNIYNNLLGLPETPDLDKIKKHFTETVTEKESRAALDRLEKASKIKARIREKILLKAEKKCRAALDRLENGWQKKKPPKLKLK